MVVVVAVFEGGVLYNKSNKFQHCIDRLEIGISYTVKKAHKFLSVGLQGPIVQYHIGEEKQTTPWVLKRTALVSYLYFFKSSRIKFFQNFFSFLICFFFHDLLQLKEK